MSSHPTLERRQAENEKGLEELSDDPLSTLQRIVLNIIDSCNRSCDFCPKSNHAKFPNIPSNRMSISDAVDLADRLIAADFKGTISVTGWGEPLLHPHIVDVMRVLKPAEAKYRIEIQTNGDIQTKYPDLYKAGVDLIIVNVYDDDVWAVNIAKRTADQYGDKMVVMDKRNPEQDLLLNNRAGGIINDKYNLQELTQPIARPCYLPFYKMVVDWDLQAYICDYDWEKRRPIGNLSDNTLREIWIDSPAMKEAREQLINGNRNFVPCQFCDVDGTKYGEEQMKVFKDYYGNI